MYIPIVAAAASYALHETVRWAANRAVKLRARQVTDTESRSWRTLSESMKNRAFLPVITVLGPRWNCHAVIASLGPVAVRSCVDCSVAQLRERAESWTIVVYDDESRTVAWKSSAEVDSDAVSFALRSGRYSLGLRFYSERDEMVVPEVFVDGEPLSCARVIAGAKSQYQRDLAALRGRHGAYYRALHFYVFYALQQSRDWVRREFVPVGNPDTEWHYGHLEPGERVRTLLDERELDGVTTYVSFYNWSSFPVHWETIRAASWESPLFDEPVAFAIRRVRTKPRGVDLPFGLRTTRAELPPVALDQSESADGSRAGRVAKLQKGSAIVMERDLSSF